MQQQSSNGIVVITPSPTHSDIANHVGTHREAVSRELAKLRRCGMIDRKQNALIVVDMEGLRGLVTEATGLAFSERRACSAG
jgi:CRP-like cAMP-binding protein